VELVTSGLTRTEETAEAYLAGSGVAAKLKREKAFPRDMIMDGALSVDVASAQVSVPRNRQRILNSIIGHAPESGEPPNDHEVYSELNQRLRALFALALYHRAFVRRTPGDLITKDLASAIQCDHQQKSLVLCLAGGAVNDKESVDLVLKAMPPNLSIINLDLKSTCIIDAELTRLRSGLPASLEDVTINLSGCPGVTDDGILIFVKGLPAKVRSFTFKGLDRTAVTEAVQKLSQGPLAQFRDWAKAKPAKREAIIAEVMGEQTVSATHKNELMERRLAMEGMLELPRKRTATEVRTKAIEVLKACGGEWPKPTTSDQE